MARRVGPPPWSPTPKKAMRGTPERGALVEELARPLADHFVLVPSLLVE